MVNVGNGWILMQSIRYLETLTSLRQVTVTLHPCEAIQVAGKFTQTLTLLLIVFEPYLLPESQGNYDEGRCANFTVL